MGLDESLTAINKCVINVSHSFQLINRFKVLYKIQPPLEMFSKELHKLCRKGKYFGPIKTTNKALKLGVVEST